MEAKHSTITFRSLLPGMGSTRQYKVMRGNTLIFRLTPLMAISKCWNASAMTKLSTSSPNLWVATTLDAIFMLFKLGLQRLQNTAILLAGVGPVQIPPRKVLGPRIVPNVPRRIFLPIFPSGDETSCTAMSLVLWCVRLLLTLDTK